MGTRLEEEVLVAMLMKRMSHGSRPSISPSTMCWIPLSLNLKLLLVS